MREVTLAGVGVPPVELLGHDQVHHGVAEELQALEVLEPRLLVMLVEVRPVRERDDTKTTVAERVPGDLRIALPP